MVGGVRLTENSESGAEIKDYVTERSEPSLRVRFKLTWYPFGADHEDACFFFFFDASFLHSPLQTNMHNEHRQT